MKKVMFFLVLSLMAVSIPAKSAELKAEKIGNKINVFIDGKFFTSYIFAENEKYPYFFPVNGPLTNGSVTSMRNGVYPHHSSLFFACDRVNGGNYWQEGLERGRIISVNAEIVQSGGDSVIISDECIWSRPGAESPLKDKRRYVITVLSPSVYLIDIEITLIPLTDVVIQKTGHSLMSARMAADLSGFCGGTIVNAEGKKGEKETYGKKSPWVDYYGKRGNKIEGLTIMQHPSNPWYPTECFTREYGFFSSDPMCWPKNGKETPLAKGKELTMKYRVVVHGGTTKDADIAGIFEKFKKIK